MRTRTGWCAALLAGAVALGGCSSTPGDATSAGTSPATTSPATAVPATSAPLTSTVPTSTVATSSSRLASSASGSAGSPAPVTTVAGADGLVGANDPGCRDDRPPVVLLHGTVSTPASNFAALTAALRADGRCVWAVLYGAAFGWGGVGDIDTSAGEVTRFVEEVRARTGAAAVDVVAFSQGALVLRAALQDGLPPGAVRLAVLLAPNYHGTTVPIAARVPAALCPACREQVAGSALLQRLAAGGELAPGVRYTSLLLADDAWVQPVADQAPRGPADVVRTQLLQQLCPDARVDHPSLPGSPDAISWVRQVLDADGAPPRQLACR